VNTDIQFTTRKHLWNQKKELKAQLDDIFTIIQNPVMPSEEDLIHCEKQFQIFEHEIQKIFNEIGSFLKSDEFKKEVEFYN